MELVRLNTAAGEDSGVDLASEPGAKNTASLGSSFTIMFGIDLEEFPKEKEFSTVFSHSDNGCYQFIINDLKSTEKDKTFQFRKTGETGNKNTFFTK
mmetsp:Transcript_43033/g.93595  ORF Transcript_43033/g.93595 Transcript_43033/m.93595 type:complete len:97 (+) Transcript_43033:322-612(+)